MIAYIKYFVIILCAIYSFIKIINAKHLSIKFCSIFIFYSSVMSLIYNNIPNQLRILHMLFVILTIGILFMIFFQLPYHTVFTISVISYSLSICTYLISIFVYSFIYVLFSNINLIIQQIIISLLQSLINIIIFRIKRFKSGMPFLIYEKNATIGIHIASIILLCTIMVKSSDKSLIYIIPLLFILISFILLNIWWRERIRTTYLKRMAQKEIDFLNNEITTLKTDNETLSALIHRDNKLIPALIMTLQDYMNSQENDISTGNNLLEQLQNLAKDRKNVIHSTISMNYPLNTTNIISIDALMNYMFQKARQNNITLSLDIDFPNENCSISKLIENVIPETELCTLLADMLDNAIIATACNSGGEIMVRFSCDVNAVYYVEVFDTGIPFEANVLVNFGRKRITTHKDFGTGIGLNTIYHIIGLHNATVIIDETVNINNTKYQKKMSVVFDNRHLYILKTNSRNDELNYLARRADLMINPDFDYQ